MLNGMESMEKDDELDSWFKFLKGIDQYHLDEIHISSCWLLCACGDLVIVMNVDEQFDSAISNPHLYGVLSILDYINLDRMRVNNIITSLSWKNSHDVTSFPQRRGDPLLTAYGNTDLFIFLVLFRQRVPSLTLHIK